MCPTGRSVSGWAWAGTVQTVVIATHAGTVITLPARWNCSSPVFRSTAATRITCLRPRKRSPAYRTNSLRSRAPLSCARAPTTFNALRNSGARPGDLGVLGIGGLGHLGVQYAAKMGFQTVAIARGKDKEPFARKLGARHYIDSQGTDPAAELNKLGGASVIIATVTNGDAMAAVLGGLAPRGVLVVIGAAGPIPVNPILLISGQRSVKGWYSGASIDSQDTLKFSNATGVQSMDEITRWNEQPKPMTG